jgi:hypothetical protein
MIQARAHPNENSGLMNYARGEAEVKEIEGKFNKSLLVLAADGVVTRSR